MDIKRSTSLIFIAKTGNAIIVFSGLAFFAGVFGSNILGLYFLFEALVGLFGMISNLGINNAVEKRLSEGQSGGEVLSSAVVIKAVLLTSTVFAILLFRGPVNQYLGFEGTIWVIGGILLKQSANLILRTMNGELRVGQTASLRLIRRLAWVTVGILGWKIGIGLNSLLGGFFVGELIVILVGVSRIDTKLAYPSVGMCWSLFDFGKFSFFDSMGGFVYNWMDVAVLGFFVTPGAIAAYEIAWRITEVVMLLSKSIRTTTFPQLSSWHAEDNTQKIETLVSGIIIPSQIITIPALFGTLFLSTEILRELFGPDYTIASLALVILMGDRVIKSFNKVYSAALLGIDRADLFAKATVVSISCNLILNVILASNYGLNGAAVATTVSSFVSLSLFIWYLGDHISIRFPAGSLGWLVIAGTTMAFSIFLLKKWVSIGSLTSLISIIMVAALIYTLILFGSNSIRKLLSDSIR